MDYYEHFKNQEGSDLPVYRGHSNQRGHGLGNWFKSFYRYIVPMIQKHALPVLKKGATIVGTEAIKTAANIANDKIAVKKFSETGIERLNEGLEQIQQNWNKQKGSGEVDDIDLKQSGSGIKRKRKKKNFSSKKKQKQSRRLKDIFDV